MDGEPQQSEYDIFRHEFRRGNDPELYWLNKYRNDNEDTQHPSLKTDIRSLYVHEDVNPEQLINRMYRVRDEKAAGYEKQMELFEEMFREQDEEDELERVAGYYQHNENWKNRLILGDSLLVMNSLLNREGMRGQVQCVYIDPPYGIKYGGNWQMRINSTNVKENDGGISGEPETIKAYRDTWELDDNYSGAEFVVRSIHFCGGKKDEFTNWKKGLQSVAPKQAKKNVERTLRMEFPDEI